MPDTVIYFLKLTICLQSGLQSKIKLMGKVIVVNENDEIIGNVDSEEAVDKKLIRRTVIVVMTNDEGELLLQKRSKNKKSYPGCWVSAATGHVEENETYEQAAYIES